MGILYTLTILLNALLLFLVQPMIAKMLLPYLGGTPAVWNTCMVFFQAMLLGGYAYSHVTTKWLGPKRQVSLHLLLFAGAALAFPIAISEASLRTLDQGAQPMLWLLRQLLATVGLPFFMLATGGPLLQHWFSKTDHPAARDPYFLYAASNLGSLAALLGYPAMIEPGLRLRQQGWLWAGGYLLLLGLLLGCARLRWKVARAEDEAADAPTAPRESVTIGRRLRWVALAFAPSSLMLGVTTFLSTDISPIPLLWVVPLALYLLTFILAFAKRQWLPVPLMIRVLPILALAMALPILLELHRPVWLMAPMHLLLFFLLATLCHWRLAQGRPSAQHLTEFYLWLSVGGVLGGLFNSLLAPALFRTVIEYPVALVIALMLCPGPRDAAEDAPRARWLDVALPVGVTLGCTAILLLLPRVAGMPSDRAATLALGLLLATGVLVLRRPVRFALLIGGLLLTSGWYLRNQVHDYGYTQHLDRNFFGVLRVSQDRSGRYRQIYHGNTLHGRQSLDPNRECEPLSYYHREGPLGSLFAALAAAPAASPNVAIIGLGTGATICYARPDQTWTFYEINPAVVRIAETPAHFTYLSKCAPRPARTILGDARLQLRNAPDHSYGLLVLDAFSSDAIPTHLLTRQALALYLSKLADGGRLVLHVSNQYLDLPPVVGDLAASEALVSRIQTRKKSPGDLETGIDASTWIILARQERDLGSLATDPAWQPLPTRPDARVWMDDFSNILGVILWK